MKLTFDDVLIEPSFNTISSRKDVDISTNIMNMDLKLPVISANMDTVTDGKMALAMHENGGVGCIHRFMSIEDQQSMMWGMVHNVIISVGISDYEFKRAKTMYEMGYKRFCIDVAHGASIDVCLMLDRLHYEFKDDDVYIMVGNFATGKSLLNFIECAEFMPDAVKVGIGPGSACTTRIKTGCGYPQLSAIQDVVEMAKDMDIAVVADGGLRTPGDIAKALAAGADAVMLGGMLSGTDETPGEVLGLPTDTQHGLAVSVNGPYKIYRGSASKESYEDQGKDQSWRTAEGEAFTVPYKGPVKNILQDIEGGLRSAFTYVGAKNLKEFQENANFVRISPSTVMENGAHGKK